MMVMRRVVEVIIKITVMVIITKITKFSGYQRVGCEQEEASAGEKLTQSWLNSKPLIILSMLLLGRKY